MSNALRKSLHTLAPEPAGSLAEAHQASALPHPIEDSSDARRSAGRHLHSGGKLRSNDADRARSAA